MPVSDHGTPPPPPAVAPPPLPAKPRPHPLRQAPIGVQVQAGEAGTTLAGFTLAETYFTAGCARLRLVVDEPRLPPGDAKVDQTLQFAFEMLLRRDLLCDCEMPVVTSSRKGALKPLIDLPQAAEDLPQRCRMAEKWMALHQASPDAVAAAPASFALHRLIARAGGFCAGRSPTSRLPEGCSCRPRR